jgi:hypothetical protein
MVVRMSDKLQQAVIESWSESFDELRSRGHS